MTFTSAIEFSAYLLQLSMLLDKYGRYWSRELSVLNEGKWLKIRLQDQIEGAANDLKSWNSDGGLVPMADRLTVSDRNRQFRKVKFTIRTKAKYSEGPK